MKTKRLGIMFGMGFGMLTTFISGCATNRIDLVDKGLVSVETVPCKNVAIYGTTVYQEGENLLVYGFLRRRSHSGFPTKVHVEAKILSSDRTVLDEACSPVIRVSAHRTRKHLSSSRFRVRFENIPPQGSTVRIICDATSQKCTMRTTPAE